MSKPLTRAEQREVDILLRGDHVYGQCWASRTLFHEVVRLRTALAAAEAKMETIEATATANARDYWQAELADERKHALDLWYLAAGLHDDDSYYGNGRKAPERLARAGEALGWPDGMRQFYVDVTGYEPEEAARRAAEVGNG